MLNDKKVLVVVPARGGSKGIKLKNLLTINGISLVERVSGIAQTLKFVDRAIVSTDHEGIASVAKNAGLDVPFLRPDYLSGDQISDFQVIDHALRTVETIDNLKYDIIVMLQPTSPLRRVEHVVKTVHELEAGRFDAVWTVTKSDSKYHPLKQLILENEYLNYFDEDGSHIIARQQLSQLYHRNGVAYACTRDCIFCKKSIKGDKTGYVLIEEPMVSIDVEEDVDYVEYLLAKRD